MKHQDGVKGIKHQEVYVVRIGFMHDSYAIHMYYLLLFITHVLLLAKLWDLLVYFSLSVMCCISAELLCVCHTVGV